VDFENDSPVPVTSTLPEAGQVTVSVEPTIVGVATRATIGGRSRLLALLPAATRRGWRRRGRQLVHLHMLGPGGIDA